MNLKLLFLFLCLAVLLTLAELKPKKHKKHHHGPHEHRGHHEHRARRGHHKPAHQRKPSKISYEEIIQDIFFGILESIGDDDDDEDQGNSDWVAELQALDGQCNPNPCLNNGECEPKGRKNYKCDCPRPFRGRRCEKGPNVCKRGKCGRGECVLTSTPPYYECKCKLPFQPPDCKRFSVCDPNPCKNNGTCSRDRNDFECQCPDGYTGNFCQIGPEDCYVDDGETYRGNVSETMKGRECLYWNSHFILQNGADPINSYDDDDGLGPHNFCRNPDGEKMPWCFFRKGRKLLWDYCDVSECSDPTDEVPTDETTTDETPTDETPTDQTPTDETPTDEEPTDAVSPQPTEAESTAAPQPATARPTAAQRPEEPAQPSPVPTEPDNTPPPPPQPFSECGKAQPKRAMTRIIGGLKVNPGAIPWQVSLQTRRKNSNQAFSHICGGVLIDSCWVLTAGHCIEPNQDMQVVMGGLSLSAEAPTEQSLRVEEAIRHERYRETRDAVYNDIGLLRLSGSDGVCANETQFVKAACLPDAQLPDGKECTISGWGATEHSDLGSNHLLHANVLLISQQKCSEKSIYGSILDRTMFCAGHLQGGVDSCQGDSGGPLTCKVNDASVVYGLVSWGDQCGRKNKPGVYTRVTEFVDWINSKMQSSSP